MTKKESSTIDSNEIAKFTAMADEWWDPNGKFKPLHRFNPCRINYIRNKLVKYFKLDENSAKSLAGLKIIDVGCGGGLVSEAMANLGAEVTGIDAGLANIEIAKIHAKKSNLKINYQKSSVEELDYKHEKSFDVVLALEIIEHVADVEDFIEECAKLVKPGGLLLIATINRTMKSLVTAKVGAEYVLRWLPRGTHDWRKFLKPYEIVKYCEDEDLTFNEIRGFEYNILKRQWLESRRSDVNYMIVFKKKTA